MQERTSLLKTSIRPDKFPYKADHYTTIALIKNQHFCLKSLDSEADFVTVFSFDFRKAFDSVSRLIVCDKLKPLGINPYIVNWIISFLDGRRQRVVVDGISTKWVIINKGVSTGTLLGPVFLTIMANDISPLNITKCFMTKFADDITSSRAVKVNAYDPSEVEVENVNKWARDNRIILHMKKTWKDKEIITRTGGRS